jgi:hypothetical protein
MSVEHIKTNERGMTRLLVTIPITQREGLAELSRRLGTSQQNLIRAAVARLLEDNKPESDPQPEPEPKARRGRKRGAR